MMSSGRTPRESGPHSFKRDCVTLKRTPLLMPLVLEKSVSISNVASFVKLSAGFLSASGSICKRIKFIQVIREVER